MSIESYARVLRWALIFAKSYVRDEAPENFSGNRHCRRSAHARADNAHAPGGFSSRDEPDRCAEAVRCNLVGRSSESPWRFELINFPYCFSDLALYVTVKTARH